MTGQALAETTVVLNQNGNYFYSIQYLRAISAVNIILYHILQKRYSVGSAGVDMFFVISGFVVWGTANKDNQSPSGFIKGRLIRIVPMYWVATLATFFVFEQASRQQLTYLIKSLFFVPYLNDQNEVWPMVLQGWSLNNEMFYYACIALLLLLKNPAKRLPLFLIASVLLVVIGQGFTMDSPCIYALTHPRVLEFLAGASLACMCNSRRGLCAARYPVGWLLLLGGFLAFAAQYAHGVTVLNCPVYGISIKNCYPLLKGLPALCILAGCVVLERQGRVLKSGVPALVGSASYSIYLFHIFIINLILPSLIDMPAPARVCVLVFASVVAGVLLHVGIEKPLNDRLKDHFHKIRHPS